LKCISNLLWDLAEKRYLIKDLQRKRPNMVK
jgi:hypothetical protein